MSFECESTYVRLERNRDVGFVVVQPPFSPREQRDLQLKGVCQITDIDSVDDRSAIMVSLQGEDDAAMNRELQMRGGDVASAISLMRGCMVSYDGASVYQIAGQVRVTEVV